MIETSREDRRRRRRFALSLKGRIFSPGGASRECTLLDLSPEGAALECAPFAEGSEVVLQLERIGRIGALCAGQENGVLRLRFVCPDATRQHIALVLGQMLESGQAHVLHSRRDERLTTANFHFTRANGERVPCDALDISLRGISVRAAVKPPVGEAVTVGRCSGRVVRHHELGIGIQFDNPGAPAAPRLSRAYQAAAQLARRTDSLV